jgi:signal transduction histidine kinase/DNA-binding response OmpR family regulator/HPt (histidine-containing phosphotransfer) domain-containing protein
MISAGKNTNPYYRFFRESEVPMAITDERGAIVTYNKVFKTLVSTFSPGHSEIKDTLFQNVLEFNEKTLFVLVIYQLLEGSIKESSFVTSFKSIDDVVHWLKIRAWLIEKQQGAENAEGPFIGFVLEDLTKERNKEEQIRAEQKIAQRAMKDKSQFLANMSHEIRTPIQTIIGMTELLQETRLDREQIEYAQQVKFSAEVLLYLINDILDYSKIEAGKMEMEEINFDLESAIEQAVEMISIEAHKKGLELILDLPPDINIMAFGDPYKFRQIVINLVKNAVKFTTKGSVTISARRTILNNSKAVKISVTDTGIGIPKNLQNQLFTTFFQGDVSNTRRFGGTGLGLSISKNLVELMNGTIEMHSNIIRTSGTEQDSGTEQGSVFTFTIPLKLPGSTSIKPIAVTPKDDYVLVVDDHPEANKRIASYLEDLGYKNVRQAGSGEEALIVMKKYAAEKKPFSFCLVDMVMSQMDGWRLAAEIKNDKTIASSKLILMVPHGLFGADAKMTLLKWFDGYINKPIERHKLAKIIDVVNDDSITELEPAENETVEEFQSQKDSIEKPNISVNGKPMIMIVEDHQVNQKLFSMIMEKIGYSSILADDGQDAVEKAHLNELAIIFMDIQMPRMNGYEAVKKLRSMGFTIPIIAVTASALSGERDRCKEAGFNDILVKPFKVADIEKMLHQWIHIGMKTLKEKQSESTGSISDKIENSPKTEQTLVPENKDIFDLNDVFDTFMGDKQVVASLIEKFIVKAAEQIEDIRENILQKDFKTGRRNAHTIKGSALTLAANELGQAASELEKAFHDEEIISCRSLYASLKTAFERFKKIVPNSGL